MSSMKYALQFGTAPSRTVPSTNKNMEDRCCWPAEFRRPVDAALHLGTPKPSSGSAKPAPEDRNLSFFM